MPHRTSLVFRKKSLLIVVIVLFCILAYRRSRILKLESARRTHERYLGETNQNSTNIKTTSQSEVTDSDKLKSKNTKKKEFVVTKATTSLTTSQSEVTDSDKLKSKNTKKKEFVVTEV